eukprot:TRINITY_DN3571_c1_g2_i1.p1 TRINITY_DN3571_c1_g2~~TRINITY_DN3571_c1_g2_i1.p1  ORF type:complete len:822 (-),score=126.35 TRINITY_DN3571_c1_g2_i1:53-2518(-)
MMPMGLCFRTFLVSIAFGLPHGHSESLMHPASREIEAEADKHLCFAQLLVGTKLVKANSDQPAAVASSELGAVGSHPTKGSNDQVLQPNSTMQHAENNSKKESPPLEGEHKSEKLPPTPDSLTRLGYQLMPVGEEFFPTFEIDDMVAQEISASGKPKNETEQPSDIWHANKTWKKIRQRHPAGVISNLGPSKHLVRWKDVSYINLTAILSFCAIAYPALLTTILVFLTVLVSTCLASEDDSGGSGGVQADLESEAGFHWQSTDLPLLPKQKLTKASQAVYACWAFFCCSVPCLMVFGIPALVVVLSRSYPQEIITALTLVTSVFVFSNGAHMLLFAGRGMLELRKSEYGDFSLSPEGPEEQVLHWVILPQYKEDIPILTIALQSVANSSIAKSSIGVVLAMEAREADASQKAEALTRIFEDKFRAIKTTYHPADLPNDPPGKASNTAWAFKELCRSMESKEEISQTIITVADADSEFSHGYFESLSSQFVEAGEEQRCKKIWQSPVFHLKNYHRLPSPVLVGTIFTCMQELAMLSDPNAFRLPYSTYSLSMDLARQVGGWDPEWIAEDYHMGIKCFIMTLGQSSVEPVLLATTNYVPEELGSWWGTCHARWTQAKRHALGFSDMAYYFMMLPLVFRYLSTSWENNEPRESRKESKIALRAHSFFNMVTYGSCLLVRLLNVHVLIGVLSTYGAMEMVLKACMLLSIPQERHIELLGSHLSSLPFYLMLSGMLGTAMSTGIFLFAYELLKDRIEGEPRHSHWLSHWIWLLFSVVVFAPFYFLFLGIAIWQAAIAVLTRSSFEYEVAPKPVLPPTGKMLDEVNK